jgi:hypothetical protein
VLDGWQVDWCRRELGATPVEELMSATLMSGVRALRLDDGRAVVVKARIDPTQRAQTCLIAQRAAADAGFPCPRPLTGLTLVGRLAVHAEEWRPGGEIETDDGPAAAARSARLYARSTEITRRVTDSPPLPNPEWVRWEHEGPGLWPPNPLHDDRPGADHLNGDLMEIAGWARKRLQSAALPRILGHADWEAQNLRWQDALPHTVHDWDSLAWLPEAALVGAAAGAFASGATPTLAPLSSSEAFLAAYQDERGPFSEEELEVAWAASLWPALHNARAEILWKHPPVALTEVLTQGEERIRRAYG